MCHTPRPSSRALSPQPRQGLPHILARRASCVHPLSAAPAHDLHKQPRRDASVCNHRDSLTWLSCTACLRRESRRSTAPQRARPLARRALASARACLLGGCRWRRQAVSRRQVRIAATASDGCGLAGQPHRWRPWSSRREQAQRHPLHPQGAGRFPSAQE
jgi:hypothetical protein